jgi:hypothetical protein
MHSSNRSWLLANGYNTGFAAFLSKKWLPEPLPEKYKIKNPPQ